MKNHPTTTLVAFLTFLCISLITPALAVNLQAAENSRSLHVEALEVFKQQATYRCPGCGSVGYGSAFVYVVDQDGNPVPYALVFGRWNDSTTRQVVSITNVYGWAPFFSEPLPFSGGESPLFRFCINTSIRSGFFYNPEQNTLNCGTSD